MSCPPAFSTSLPFTYTLTSTTRSSWLPRSSGSRGNRNTNDRWSTHPGFLGAMTVIVTVALLLPDFGSGCDALTFDFNVITPGEFALRTIRMVTLPPFGIVPRLQWTVLAVWVQVPWVVVTERIVKPAGAGSVNTTPVAVEGPLLVTTSVTVSC